MRPEDEDAEELSARLRAELDTLPLGAPHPMQARYHQPAVGGASLRRFGPVLAGAAAAIVLIGFAAATVNPSIFRTHSAGSKQQMTQPAGLVTPSPTSKPAASPAPETSAEPAGTPEPEASGSEDHSGSAPIASPTPEAEGSGGSDGAGSTGDGGASTSPSPSSTADP